MEAFMNYIIDNYELILIVAGLIILTGVVLYVKSFIKK